MKGNECKNRDDFKVSVECCECAISIPILIKGDIAHDSKKNRFSHNADQSSLFYSDANKLFKCVK